MVDVGDKPDQLRIAIAKGTIFLDPATVELIRENNMQKGDVLATAEIAGIMGGKKTGELIPLCHPLPVTQINVNAELDAKGVMVTAGARYTGKTGVEMEALTAVSVALLTVYDMCKAVDKNMTIGDIRLIKKTRGNSSGEAGKVYSDTRKNREQQT